jgi:hypothetical protein
MSLRTSTQTIEGIYQGSKYLKYQVLCDLKDLRGLFQRLGAFKIYPLTGLVSGEAIEQDAFAQEYGRWIEGLKMGRLPTDSDLKKILACAFSLDEDALWKQQVPGGRFFIKMGKPCVQVQAHFFSYSPVDGVFRPMTMGPLNIFWGLQFSFPQIYQDAKTMEFLKAGGAPNAELFQTIKQWVRDFTRATPFVVEETRTNVPIRLGKNCFSWIHNHPQLGPQKIGVYAG